MAQDLTDTDALVVGEATDNSDQPTGAQEQSQRLTFTEQNIVIIHDGLWDLCPPYEVELVQGLTTVASCGNHGYEEPTQGLKIQGKAGDADAVLALYEFILYDGAHFPVNLTGDITFDVATTAGQFQYSIDVEIVDGPAGQVQTALLPTAGVGPDSGLYQARFYVENRTQSFPTRPIELEVLEVANPKCLPRLPWPKWAEEAGLSQGYKSTDNWHAFERWAQLLLDECLTGSCDPMAVRCHVILGCGGLEYSLVAAAGDYAMGGTSVSGVDGLVLPEPGVWHIGFNGHGDVGTGAHMGQGLFTVVHPDVTSYDYGVAVGNEDDGVATHVSMSGSVDHMVPVSATVGVTSLGSSDGIFPFSFGDNILYAHRIECTDVLVTDYP